MARVYVSVGSNMDRERNIRSCIEILKKRFGSLVISTVYQSRAVGFEGDDFFNLVVGFDTKMDVYTLVKLLRSIEACHNRRRNKTRFSPRTLDLDLLIYDDLVLEETELHIPRDEITRYAFVLCPLAEVAGQWFHPLIKHTLTELWAAFDKNRERLRPVNLEF